MKPPIVPVGNEITVIILDLAWGFDYNDQISQMLGGKLVRIVTCIKQVPDTQEIKIDFEAGIIAKQGVPLIVNPFDEYAIEEAVRIKEKGDAHVTVLTVGAPAADEALRTALAMGCDAAVLISDPAFENADTWATAVILAKALTKAGPFDLIFFGKQTFDGDTGAVAPRVAALLGLPVLNYTARILELDPAGGKIKVERLLEDGRETVTAKLPVVISVVKEINEPRYPSLMGMRKAKKVDVPTWDGAALGLSAQDIAPLARVGKLQRPPTREQGEMMTGETSDAAGKLAAKLLDGKII